MACLVSLFSFTPLTSHKTLIKDLQAWKTANCRMLLHSSNSITGINFVAPKSAGKNKNLLSVTWHHNPNQTHLRVCCGNVFVDDDKLVCSPNVIFGFWVGPDIDDGWGFVEAIVICKSNI
ncbi:uncharacterized protein LOC111878928 [Lactuca sativa]|uniref:Uncharacterized protein n=1 Tax=Lactuca sativa TaxID=4236 RepID=A0A9R1UIF5_LACSA|nr:uncharacterized protein LOC111878928 [Lactuca sativa]KAJ0187605.1 hypothetical protein LSAT_V11C900505620 [Lactuca sativa]